MSFSRLEHVCHLLRSPLRQERRLRIAMSFMHSHCEAPDVCDWMHFLLSSRAVTAKNGIDILVRPVFISLDKSLRIALISLFSRFLGGVPPAKRQEWTTLTQSHLRWNTKTDPKARPKDTVVTNAQTDDSAVHCKERAQLQNDIASLIDAWISMLQRIADANISDETAFAEIWSSFEGQLPSDADIDASQIAQRMQRHSSEVLSVDAMHSFELVRRIIASHASASRVCLWLIVPQILARPKCRRIRQTVCDCDATVLSALLRLLLALYADHAQIAVF